MKAPVHRSVAFQPDTCHRFAFLARLAQVAVDTTSRAVNILDIACGTVRMTETSLGPALKAVRVNVAQFFGPQVAQFPMLMIVSGQALPFDRGSFDHVVDIVQDLPREDRLRRLTGTAHRVGSAVVRLRKHLRVRAASGLGPKD